MRGGSRGSGGDTYGVGQIFSEDHCVKKLVNEDEPPPPPLPSDVFNHQCLSLFFLLSFLPSLHVTGLLPEVS